MNVKQVIIIRAKFPDGKGGSMTPRKGKMVSQGAHASMKVFFDRMQDTGDECKEIGPQEGWNWSVVRSWIDGCFTKVVVQCESEEELLGVYQRALSDGLPCSIIQDNGQTEFGGVPTYTAVAIGPDLASRIDPLTGHLKLL